MEVFFPWPPARLSPNARIHWAVLSKAKKAYRKACFDECLKAGMKPGIFDSADRLRVALEFVPPNRHRRDTDNCLAAMKAGLDGLADALGVDDRYFVLELSMVTDRIAGHVRVRVEVEK